MRNVIKPAIVLFLTALIASLSLTLMREITKDRIAQNAIDEQRTAMNEVLPHAADGTFGDIIETGGTTGVLSYCEAIADGQTTGYAIAVAAHGYGGMISMLVGIDADGVVTGVRIIEHTETPGLGSNAANVGFLAQYDGKAGALTVTKSAPKDNEIQAITSATITTKAVTSGVNEALAFYETLQIEEGAQ